MALRLLFFYPACSHYSQLNQLVSGRWKMKRLTALMSAGLDNLFIELKDKKNKAKNNLVASTSTCFYHRITPAITLGCFSVHMSKVQHSLYACCAEL